jgi:hypothetical protein
MDSSSALSATVISPGQYRGEIRDRYLSDAFLRSLGNIAEYVQEGRPLLVGRERNRNVVCSMPAGTDEDIGRQLDVVIKSFAGQHILKDLADARRGTKAARTWQNACFLSSKNVGTPSPVCYLERWDGKRLAESYYVVEYCPSIVSFRRELIRLFREEPECALFMELLEAVANGTRKMHDAGFVHNDLGNQNIYLSGPGRENWDRIQFVDLNRGRIRPELFSRDRARDLSRIWLPSDLLRVFREMYYGGNKPPVAFLKWERFFRDMYSIHANSRKLRHPVRHFRERHARPRAEEYPSGKDMWVWDSRSAQPISLMRRKDRNRHHSLGRNLYIAGSTALSAAPVWKEYLRLRDEAFAHPVAMKDRIGVCLQLGPGTAQREIELLSELGTPPAFVRLYRHEEREVLEFKKDRIRELGRSGVSISAALVQDRRSTVDLELWREFLDSTLPAIAGEVDFVEVGHAINRVKWGIWELKEYGNLFRTVADIAEGCAGVRLTGPSVIDFEYPYLLAALRSMYGSCGLWGLSHHLYVDRRGGPENKQGPFSLLEKCLLARAVARWAGNCEDRFIVSEVNWPLKGTGVFSPVGAPYESPGPRYNDPSVTEDEYADFMLRYLLMSLCSGAAQAVYWWRLAARGFGLVDDSAGHEWWKRPAFGVLKYFLSRVNNSTFSIIMTPAEGVYFYVFKSPDRKDWAIAYSVRQKTEVRVPFRFRALTDAFGNEMRASEVLTLGPRPVYVVDIEH